MSQRSWLWGAAAIVIVACGAAGFLAQSRQARVTEVSSMALDVGAPAASPALPPASPRPAPSAQPSAKAAPMTQPAPKPKTAAVPVTVALFDARYKALLAGPAKFIASKTMLGDARGLRGFLADPARVDGYLKHPVIRSALGSPTIVRAVLKPTVIEAFLTSAAMRDAQAVKALAESKLVKEIARAHGVQTALTDPAFVQQLLVNPQTMAWLSGNPAAFKALMQFGPAFAAANLKK